VPQSDKVRSLCIIKRPARIATDSGLNGDIPATHLHGHIQKFSKEKWGNNLGKTVVLPEPLGPPTM